MAGMLLCGMFIVVGVICHVYMEAIHYCSGCGRRVPASSRS
jgi:hypothetical protein